MSGAMGALWEVAAFYLGACILFTVAWMFAARRSHKLKAQVIAEHAMRDMEFERRMALSQARIDRTVMRIKHDGGKS